MSCTTRWRIWTDNWSRFFAVCICAPGVDMITMLKPEEIVARDHLRHPAARQYAK